MCHFTNREANLSNALPSVDAAHPSYEVIRGDRTMFKEQLLVSVLCLSLIVKFKLKLYFCFLFFVFETSIPKK